MNIERLIRSNSAWSLTEIESFLGKCVVPLRLACVAPSGIPIVCSLWYLYDDEKFWCATQMSARVVKYVERYPFCGFEIAPETPPYKGVRGQGQVTLSKETGLDLLRRLIDRYIGSQDSEFARWLINRGDNEVAIAIEPTWITAWDFSRRMAND